MLKNHKKTILLTFSTLLFSFNVLSQSYENYVAQNETCIDLASSIREIRTVSATYEGSVKALFINRPGTNPLYAGQLHSQQAFTNHINSINGVNIAQTKYVDNFNQINYNPDKVYGYSYKTTSDSDQSAAFALPADTKEFTFAVRNPDSPLICHCVFVEERSQLSCDSWHGELDKIQAEYNTRMQDYQRLNNSFSRIRFFNPEDEHEKRKAPKVRNP
ncbi:MAG TPA: hypothetical protein PKC21_06540 [Oligoflexia bacterium]|nr:hypothetical protein [Oligoflexia bacterium]HMR24993.1 hypothetical protein [Oligoflexia bacterium]